MAGGLVTGWMGRSVINALHPSDEVVWERNEELLGLEIRSCMESSLSSDDRSQTCAHQEKALGVTKMTSRHRSTASCRGRSAVLRSVHILPQHSA